MEMDRSSFLATLSSVTLGATTANAFEGGIGGLGKTKPETGVELFSELSAPVQNAAGRDRRTQGQ